MRLIDADALKQIIGSYNPIKYTYEYGDVITVADIDNAPTIEAEPVKRGKWVLNDRHIYECSECGLIPTQEEKDYWHYCPNCGAKMSEGSEK